MKIRFTKMHGLGNDFVVLDAIRQSFVPSPAQAKWLADRHFGIGCDQILVVESPRDAAHQAMSEVSGPIVAITLVLASVFVPLAFLGGVTGQFYKQFAVTIAAAVIISGFNSLTLSPALAAMLRRLTSS